MPSHKHTPSDKIYQMEGTPLSSTSQLTDPPLYSIFGGRNNIYSENQEDEIEMSSSVKSSPLLGKDNGGKFGGAFIDGSIANSTISEAANGLSNTITLFILNLIKTAVFGTAICYLFQSVHSSNPNTIPKYSTFQWYTNEEDFSILNVVLSSCILDGIISLTLGKLNGNKQENTSHQKTSVLQLIIAIIGIVFGFKKIVWNVTAEANFAFLVVNFFFSRYLGCTIHENITGFIIAFASYVYDYYNNAQIDTQLTSWRCLFAFFVTVIFIKLRKSNTLF